MTHGLQHTRLPCPSLSPEVCSSPHPTSQWCHPTISSSVVPFSCLQSFPASGSFPMSQLSASVGQSIGASASVLPERLLLNNKTPGFLASRGDEFNPGPETRLDRSELLCNKVLLKYKGDRENFRHRHQKGAERVPPCQSSAGCYIVTSSLLMKERNVLKLRMAPGPSSIRCILG